MGITRYPNGVFATPNLGANRLIDVFNSGNIWFVDGDSGLSSNTGKSPDDALAKPSQAIAATDFARHATIYIRPRTTAASAQTYYVDDITIPITKPGVSIIGCGNSSPNSYAGVQLKPTTVTGHLVEVNGASLLLENLRLTLTGGTADQNKSIVHAVNASGNKPAGLTIRGCWFANDKSHPSISGSDATAAVGLALEEAVIEDCVFFNCLGAIAIQSVLGSSRKIYIRRNYFTGETANVDCYLIISINASTCASIVVEGNMFADGLPAHSGGGTLRFIHFSYLTAGTGILANNYFAAADTEANFGETGSQAIIADNFFNPGNWCEGSGTTAPYGIITT